MSFIRKFNRDGATYLAEVENKRVNGKVVQRFIRYIGREADGRTVLSTSISDINVEAVKLYGPLLVLHHLAEGIGLSAYLGSYAGEILSMVYAHCLDYRSVNNMPKWFERTDLNLILNLREVTESRLLSAMDFLEQCDAEQLQRKIHEGVRAKYNLTNSGVIYDVTNTYFYGKNCPLGKLGHDKDGVKGRPLVQIGFGCTKDEGIAVFHKVFHGNVHDSKTLHDILSSFGRYGIKKGVLVYDRGTVSGKNIKDAKDLHWETLCGLPLNEGLKKFWRPVLATEKIASFANRVHFNNSTFFVITRPYTIEGVKGTLALCLNEQQRQSLREARYQDLAEAQQLPRTKIRPALEKFFDPDRKIKQKVVDAAEEFDGYSCLFCTQAMSKQNMVEEYFDKDLVEKAFRMLKGVAHLRPIRHWLYKRVVGHIFICFLAYLLLSLLRVHLKPLQISPEEALEELETMYKIYLRDSSGNLRISRVVTLSKKQVLILKAVDKRLLKV
jgi:transposase